MLCLYSIKSVAFCSVLSNTHNNILHNLELFQYNVFIFLVKKNTKHILINVAIYKYGGSQRLQLTITFNRYTRTVVEYLIRIIKVI